MQVLLHLTFYIVGLAALWFFVLEPLFAFIDVMAKRKR